MSDQEDPSVDEQLNVKELRRRQARSRYKRAKELYENSEYGIKQKAKLKDLRKAAYAKAKEKRKSIQQSERQSLGYNKDESLIDHEPKLELCTDQSISHRFAKTDDAPTSSIDFSKVKLTLVYSAD